MVDKRKGHEWPIADDPVYVCTLPDPLGRVTKLSVRNGRVVAETESGTPFIVPFKVDGGKS
jgi:hypothetical protein